MRRKEFWTINLTRKERSEPAHGTTEKVEPEHDSLAEEEQHGVDAQIEQIWDAHVEQQDVDRVLLEQLASAAEEEEDHGGVGQDAEEIQGCQDWNKWGLDFKTVPNVHETSLIFYDFFR